MIAKMLYNQLRTAALEVCTSTCSILIHMQHSIRRVGRRGEGGGEDCVQQEELFGALECSLVVGPFSLCGTRWQIFSVSVVRKQL